MDENLKEAREENLRIEKKEIGRDLFGKSVVVLIGIVAVLLIFNMFQILGISGRITGSSIKKLDASQISEIKSTGQAVAALFPVEDIRDGQDAIEVMISQGTPDYGEAMGVSFDDPVSSLDSLARTYNTVKQDVKENNPDVWQRYLSLATKPVGISCEYCCGVGPIGITKSGELKCGCQHNPAAQTLTMLLMKDTNYDNAEVLREVLKWKALWFPKDMVNLALKASGGEIEADLPGMVGGC